METLGKFKTNFFKNKNSFNIGFNNRSPLSKLDGSIPTQSSEAVELSPKFIASMKPIDNSRLLESQEGVGEAIGDAAITIGKAIMDRKKRKKEAENEKVENTNSYKKEFRKVSEDLDNIDLDINSETFGQDKRSSKEIKEEFLKQSCWSSGGTVQTGPDGYTGCKK